jgi:hypothetical protein
MADVFWGFWDDYEKVNIGDRVYAKVGDRFYTRHAVDRFLPSGHRLSIEDVPTSRKSAGSFRNSRSIPPSFIEDAIVSGKTRQQIRDGVPGTVHMHGDLEVVTESNKTIVVTVSYRHS